MLAAVEDMLRDKFTLLHNVDARIFNKEANACFRVLLEIKDTDTATLAAKYGVPADHIQLLKESINDG